MGIQVPERAQMIRAILLEVERFALASAEPRPGLPLYRF
ncbi:Formate hydrogenlyase subunit 5 [Salmonella enterica subsp. arizonae]|uniref:Formate hydrogenlyase subunit 5 n=1 Tax=Salmonella enterica subsp. arizonae TaxID=59203 RepID=A0A379T9I2_SALER|nr:Formate hydrogenlyase subunit 5 [Salmonella enterica subsp. arizonae]